MLGSFSSKTIFLLDDDGVNVYLYKSGVTQFIDSVPWGAGSFETDLYQLLVNRCERSSVILLNDMVEQHYRKERVPKVSPLDRASLVARRLANAYPAYQIRASLKLDEKIPALDGQVPSDSYLFVALPELDGFSAILKAVQRAGTQISSVYVLPVEATGLIRSMLKSNKINSSLSACDWCIFVGLHKNGYLRQVVTKKGQIALTRMTPISIASGHENLIPEIVEEIRGTISYLSRFGYAQTDGLGVVVALPDDMSATQIREMIDFATIVEVGTVNEFARSLGIAVSSRQTKNTAEILHVGWVAKTTKHVLPIKIAAVENVNRPTKIASSLIAAGAACLAFLLYLVVMDVLSVRTKMQESQVLAGQLSALENDRSQEAEKRKEIGLDYMLVTSISKVYQELQNTTIYPLPVIEKIGAALGPDIPLNSLSIRPDNSSSDALSDTPEIGPDGMPVTTDQRVSQYDLALKIVFPSSYNPEKGVSEIRDFAERLKTQLPDYKVSIVKQVADLSYTGNFVEDKTVGAQQEQEKELSAEILIKGHIE